MLSLLYYIVDLNFLSDPRDRVMMQKGLATAKVLVAQSASVAGSRRFHYFELLPGPLFRFATSTIWFDRFCNLFASTYFHACGTCSMGSVVDDELRVLTEDGSIIRKLRVADASVIPHIPTGPIAAVCMAIGRGLGELVLLDRASHE